MENDRAKGLVTAAMYEREGRLEDAGQIYRGLLATDGNDFEALLRLSSVTIAQGDREAGERLIRRCAQLSRNTAVDHVHLATAFLALRLAGDAVTHCRQALVFDPALIHGHVVLGSAFQAQRRFDDAIAAYNAALAIDPRSTQVHYNIATALQALGRQQEAISSYERALDTDPDVVEAHYGLGTALVALGRNADAIPRFERALDRDPDFAEAAVALGQILNALGRHEAAAVRFRQALDVDPDYIDALVGFAKSSLMVSRHTDAFAAYEAALRLRPDDISILTDFAFALGYAGRADKAVIHYQRAASFQPDNADILVNLGAVLIQIGQFDEARGIYERAMALKPAAAAPYAALLALRRPTATDPILLAAERLLGASQETNGSDSIKLQFALGNAYADLGDHQRSFEHLMAANASKRRRLNYNEIETLGLYEKIERVFTKELLERGGTSGHPSEMPVFILGYPRSGSTLVEQILASHPSVSGGGERLDFPAVVRRYCSNFPDQVPLMDEQTLMRLGADYVESLARGASGAIRITDKMLGNYGHIGLIRMALPNARIIHVSRDPVDTCWSCYSSSFEGEAVPFTYDLGELGRNYCAYVEMMQHWHTILPSASMLEVRYEDVVANFEHEARRIVAYCALPWDDACLEFHKTERVIRTASAIQVRRPLYNSSVGRAKALGDLLQPLLEALA